MIGRPPLQLWYGINISVPGPGARRISLDKLIKSEDRQKLDESYRDQVSATSEAESSVSKWLRAISTRLAASYMVNISPCRSMYPRIRQDSGDIECYPRVSPEPLQCLTSHFQKLPKPSFRRLSPKLCRLPEGLCQGMPTRLS